MKATRGMWMISQTVSFGSFTVTVPITIKSAWLELVRPKQKQKQACNLMGMVGDRLKTDLLAISQATKQKASHLP